MTRLTRSSSSGYRRFRRQLSALRKHRIHDVVLLAAQARKYLEQHQILQPSLLARYTS